MGEYDLRKYSSNDFLREFRIDPSQRIRSLRERLNRMDLGQAGGMSSRIALEDSLPMLRIRSLAELPGEQTREAEVQVAVAMQMLGLNEDYVLEMRRELDVKRIESDDVDDAITDLEMIETLDKIRAKDPKRWEEVARIVREEMAQERQFAIQIKTN